MVTWFALSLGDHLGASLGDHFPSGFRAQETLRWERSGDVFTSISVVSRVPESLLGAESKPGEPVKIM